MQMIDAGRPRILTPLLGIAMPAGCGSSTPVALKTPTFFSFNFDDGALVGQYNPAGFNAKQIQNSIAGYCTNGRIGAYQETPQPDGLVAFVAQYPDGTAYPSGYVEVEKPS